MKKMIVLGSLLISLVSVSSCRKKNNEESDRTVKKFTMLTPGNYWVYQTFNIGDTSVWAPPSMIDSVYVADDTVWKGNVYHKLVSVSSSAETRYLRDSLDYLVDISGRIEFSANDFTNDLVNFYWIAPGVGRNDSVGLFTRKMVDKDMAVAVPAGNFITSTIRESIQFHPDNIANGQAVRSRDTRYAIGVGIVTEILPYYLAVPSYVERRLIRYHVQ